MDRKQKKKKAGSFFSNIVLIIALAVFCYSAFQLYGIFSTYKKGNDEYDEIKNIAITREKVETKGDGEENGEEEAEERFLVDFDKLKEINPDTVAWIRFEEPSIINYPVVHSKDNQEYLKKLLEKENILMGHCS